LYVAITRAKTPPELEERLNMEEKKPKFYGLLFDSWNEMTHDGGQPENWDDEPTDTVEEKIEALEDMMGVDSDPMHNVVIDQHGKRYADVILEGVKVIRHFDDEGNATGDMLDSDKVKLLEHLVYAYKLQRQALASQPIYIPDFSDMMVWNAMGLPFGTPLPKFDSAWRFAMADKMRELILDKQPIKELLLEVGKHFTFLLSTEENFPADTEPRYTVAVNTDDNEWDVNNPHGDWENRHYLELASAMEQANHISESTASIVAVMDDKQHGKPIAFSYDGVIFLPPHGAGDA
jgi:hypothetical protein